MFGKFKVWMSKFLKYLILIWWCYTPDKLQSKSTYDRRIWILNLLYVHLLLCTWFKPSCHYCTVILIHPEQKAIIFIELAKVQVQFYVKKCFHHSAIFLIIFYPRIGKEHESYRNYVLLCRLYEILLLICFLLKTIFVILKKMSFKYMNLQLLEDNLFSYQYNYGILPFKGWF